MEPVFRGLEISAMTLVWATGSRISYQGLENIPAAGGAVIAINHTGYVDFLPAALAAKNRKRRMRFMIKAEMQDVAGVGFLIKHAKAIPVDRRMGSDAYTVAVGQLRAGEIVGVYPEATISRSFELKDFKTGASRMALEAGVPIVPLIVWGAHRVWTKDNPKRLGRKHFPIRVSVGEPIAPTGSAYALTRVLKTSMTQLLHDVQEEYPHPADEPWVPRRLGGSAPTPDEASALEEAEVARRANRSKEK